MYNPYEIVKKFDPSSAKIKIEDKPRISQYQLELNALEKELGNLGSEITSLRERLANLKKMKPE